MTYPYPDDPTDPFPPVPRTSVTRTTSRLPPAPLIMVGLAVLVGVFLWGLYSDYESFAAGPTVTQPPVVSAPSVAPEPGY